MLRYKIPDHNGLDAHFSIDPMSKRATVVIISKSDVAIFESAEEFTNYMNLLADQKDERTWHVLKPYFDKMQIALAGQMN